MPDGSTKAGASLPLISRLELWHLVAVGLWFAFLGGILLYVASDYDAYSLLLDVWRDNRTYHITLGAFFTNAYTDLNASILFHLYLAGWGVVALLKLRKLGTRPADWSEFRPFSWVVVCVTALAGFPVSALIARGLDALPAGWVLDIARLVVTPFLMPVVGVATIGALVSIGGLLSYIFIYLFVRLPLQVFEYLNDRDIRQTILNHQKRGLSGQIYRFHLWLIGEPVPAPPDESKGARLATPAEIAALNRPRDPAAMAFGHSGNPLFLKTDKHVLLMASTRSGKGVTLIIPHLLRYSGSAFVLDPKGENAKATIRQRTALNDKVHVLDPFGITGLPQARFNPLSRFTPENMEAESKALAAALFVTNDRGGQRDHFDAGGQQLLAAIILYVYVSTDIPSDKKDLPTVRHILLGGLKLALEKMKEIDAADGLLRELAISFEETPSREFGSIVSTAQRQTEVLDNPYMVACLSATGKGAEVDFKAWKSGTMTVYLCLSAPKFPTFNRWLRLLLTSALDEMTDMMNPPPLPVCFMLDELATLGHLTAVENAVGLAAGYGIQLVSVFQDVAQMRDLYKGRWASFVGNAGVRALFNLDDYDTAEYRSKFIGGRLAETHSRQENEYGLSSGQNIGEAMRPLLPPDQLMMNFASDKMLVLAQGARPIVTDRIAYFKDRGLGGLWDDPRRPVSARQINPLRRPSPPAAPPAAARTAPPTPPPVQRPPSSPAAAVPPGSKPTGILQGPFGPDRDPNRQPKGFLGDVLKPGGREDPTALPTESVPGSWGDSPTPPVSAAGAQTNPPESPSPSSADSESLSGPPTKRGTSPRKRS